MNLTASDERIESVVNLVLQAVDQRLATVRDQMTQLSQGVVQSHQQLQAQIDECRELCMMAAESAEAAHAAARPTAGSDGGLAAQQLMDVANVLTQHVATFEQRVNQYTDDRVSELQAMIDDLELAPVAVAPVAVPAVVTAPAAIAAPAAMPLVATAPAAEPMFSFATSMRDVDDLAPAAARLGSLSGRPSAATAVPAAIPPVAVVPAAAAPAAAAPAVVPAVVPASSGSLDMDELSAQMSARLAAVIDRALAQ